MTLRQNTSLENHDYQHGTKVRNIRLIVAYDGTDLHGYQRQVNGYTVQQALEEALSKVCNESITVHGSSRTDAGVHAKFQVVAFYTTGTIPTHNLLRALIAHLPPYIVVKEAEDVPYHWHPRKDSVGKAYVYSIHNGTTEDPLSMRYHWYINKRLEIESMRKGATYLVGTHDFSAFQGSGSTTRNPIKTILALPIITTGDTISVYVFGTGFLYHMVRNIVGLLVDIGLGRRCPEDIPMYLALKDRKNIGKTAPAKGLCLEEVFFTTTQMEEAIVKIAGPNHGKHG